MKTIEVFEAFGKGLQSGTDEWKKVVASNVTFEGPVDKVEGIDAFAKLNASFLPMIKGTEVKNVKSIDEYVLTQVIFDVEMPSGKVISLDMSEWYTIEEGKITNIKVYYDADEFRKELNP